MSNSEFIPRSNSQIWRYDNGQWTPLDNFHKPWPDGMDFDDWLAQDGFEHLAHHGAWDWISVTVYQSRDGILLAELRSQYDAAWFIYLADFPSYIGFMRETAPLCELAVIREELAELRTGFSRLFRVQHGHDVHSPCPECDPNAYQEQKEWCRQSKERQKGNATSSQPPAQKPGA